MTADATDRFAGHAPGVAPPLTGTPTITTMPPAPNGGRLTLADPDFPLLQQLASR